MNKTIVIVSACLFLWQSVLMAGADAKASRERAPKKDVSIYQVPWRCPAALQIGCGSHAKPILLELEILSEASGCGMRAMPNEE